MAFEFATATRIIFGDGAIQQVAPAAKQWGRRVLVVTGRSTERAERLRKDLEAGGVQSFDFAVEGEPTVDLIARGLDQARAEDCDVVIALGGGSVIDAGKAIAGLLTNPGEVLDYLEVVGKGNALQNPAAPFIAVPTTAGTGSEVTRNAVLGVPARQVKVSLRSPFLLPRLAVVDPELTLDLPPAITARTGLDALTQLIEAYVSIRANPMTDGFCVQGIPLAARSLRRAFHHGRRPGSAQRYVARGAVQRTGACQCRPGCRPRICRSAGRQIPRAARSDLRGHSALRNGNEPARLACSRAAKRCASPLPGSGAHAHRPGDATAEDGIAWTQRDLPRTRNPAAQGLWNRGAAMFRS